MRRTKQLGGYVRVAAGEAIGFLGGLYVVQSMLALGWGDGMLVFPCDRAWLFFFVFFALLFLKEVLVRPRRSGAVS
jgi:uncharacterized membrane protein